MAAAVQSQSGRFLGKGFAFPFQISSQKGGIKPQGSAAELEGVALIRASVSQIIQSRLRRRFFRRDFGSPVFDSLFEPIAEAFLPLLQHDVAEALSKWEPRIELLNVGAEQTDTTQGIVQISIEYRILTTNTVDNMVLPFFKFQSQAA
jgi:hypothetical protein